MGWSPEKILGLGALLMGGGLGLAAALADKPKERSSSLRGTFDDTLKFYHFDLGPAGLSVHLELTLALPSRPQGTVYVGVNLLKDGAGVKSTIAEFADSDGGLCINVESEDSREVINAILRVPYAALPKGCEGPITVNAWAISEEGPLLASSEWTIGFPTAVERHAQDPIAALTETAVQMVRSSGELERAEVRAIKDFMKEAAELDQVGLKHVLRQYIHAAKVQEPDAIAMAERLRECFPSEHHPDLLMFLYTVAKSDGVVDRAEEAYIVTLCHHLGISPVLWREIRKQYVEVSSAARKRSIEVHYREIFVHLYPDADSARRLAKQVRLPVERIDFRGGAEQIWFRILEEASRQGTLIVESLLQVARREHPFNLDLE